MQEYAFEINLKIISMGIEAKNKKEAIKTLKDIFLEDNNIILDDREITLI